MIEYNKESFVGRFLGCLICIPTVVVMFLDWIRISFLENLKNKVGFLDFLDSDFTLLEMLDFIGKIGDNIGSQTANIIWAIRLTEAIAIFSIVILFITLLFGKTKTVKKMGVTAFGFCTLMFFVFIGTLHIINLRVEDSAGGQVMQVVQATPWPYVMFICSVALLFICAFGVDVKIRRM
ncbi:MAG: hypothetical protein RR069_05365 [Oscillospiraceae bacterium]